MATISTAISQDYLNAYDGYDQQEVGMGLIRGTYATPSYQKKKIKNLAIGLISEVAYGGAEHDRNPLIIPWAVESPYQTVLALNLHYVPETYRRAIMKAILDMNASRIRSNQSMAIDYRLLKRQVPVVQYIVRRYKLIGISVMETYPLVEVPTAIQGNNRWQSHYRAIMEGRA